MSRKLCFVICVLLVACQPNTSSPTSVLTPVPTMDSQPVDVWKVPGNPEIDFLPLQVGSGEVFNGGQTTTQVNLAVNDVSFVLTPPQRWLAYFTENGVVVVEQMGSIATGGKLEGVLAYVFVPTLEDASAFSLPADQNVAQVILSHLTEKSGLMTIGMITHPVAFDCNGYDAAYYLRNNGNGTVTLLVAVVAPNAESLIVFSISAPERKSGQIRSTLFGLMASLNINGVQMNAMSLRHLPNPLEFPQRPPSVNVDVYRQ